MIISSQDDRTKISMLAVGAGRGGRIMQPHFADYNTRSTTLRLDPIWIDPGPGKAKARAKEGNELGLNTSFVETTGEQYLANQPPGSTPPALILIDAPRSLETMIRLPVLNPLFVNIIIDLPGHGITAWSFRLTPEDEEQKESVADFFGGLDDVKGPVGTEAIFGRDGQTINRVRERPYRSWQRDGFEKNVGKVVHGLRPETGSAEVTFNGRDTSQVVVLKSDRKWKTAKKLLHHLEASLESPVRPGTDFAIVELGQDTIRIHRARYRVTDNKTGLVRRRYDSRSGVESGGDIEPVPYSVLSRLSAAYVAD